MEDIITPGIAITTLFIALPWLILHYVTKWKQAPKITHEDEQLLDELHMLARRLEDLLGMALPLEPVVEDAEAWERGVDELASEDPEVADYVRQLEEAKDTVDLPEATGDAIAREFERYLRRRDDRG